MPGAIRRVPSAAMPRARHALMGRVGGAIEVQFFFQAPAGLKQAISPIPRDRAGLAPALGVQCAATLPQPGASAFGARHEPFGIKVQRGEILVVDGLRRCRLVAFALKPWLGFAQRLAPALAGTQMLGQFVAALTAVELILTTIGLGGLLQDLWRSARNHGWS